MPQKFQESRDSAKKHLQIADHMFSVTFKLMKDPRLLIAILENIFLAYTESLAAVLYHGREFKEIPLFQDTFEGRLNTFKEYCIKKYAFDNSLISDIQEIRNILIEKKKCPIEFVKNSQFVLCSANYETKSIGAAEISSYLNKAKLFILATDNIISKNEGIFGRSKE